MAHARETFKLWAGSLLEVAAPWIRRDLDTDRHSGRFVKQKRWILYARTARARVRGDASALQKSLHHEIVDQLAKLAGGGDYGRLIEVGCGAGRVLEHCASAVPEVSDFIGVDINSVIIARDGAEYAQNPRLQFLAADASVWLQQTAQPGTILLTHGGVMEYFLAETPSKMFKNMALHHPLPWHWWSRLIQTMIWQRMRHRMPLDRKILSRIIMKSCCRRQGSRWFFAKRCALAEHLG